MALTISRRENERVFIGEDIIVEVRQIQGSKVRLSITAPSEVNIRREELPEEDE